MDVQVAEQDLFGIDVGREKRINNGALPFRLVFTNSRGLSLPRDLAVEELVLVTCQWKDEKRRQHKQALIRAIEIHGPSVAVRCMRRPRVTI